MEIESKLSLPGIEPGLPVYIELFLGIAYRFVFEFQIIYLVFFVLCEMFIEPVTAVGRGNKTKRKKLLML